MIVAVIGLGKFGFKMATKLQQKGAEVLAIDEDPEVLDRIKHQVTEAVQCDITNELALREINLQEAHVALVAMGEHLEKTIMTIVLLKRLGISKIIARASNTIQEQILKEIGATQVLSLEEEMAEILSDQIMAPFLRKKINFLDYYTIAEVMIPSHLDNTSCKEYNLSKIQVLGYGKSKPTLDEQGFIAFDLLYEKEPEKFFEGDLLLVGGLTEDVEELLKEFL